MWRKDFIEGARGLHYEDEEEAIRMRRILMPYKKDGRTLFSIRGEMGSNMTLRDSRGKVLARYTGLLDITKDLRTGAKGRGNLLAKLMVDYVLAESEVEVESEGQSDLKI